MHTLKLKILITLLMVGFGYFILSLFINFMVPVYNNPQLLISPITLYSLLGLILVVSAWAYALLNSLQSIYSHVKYGSTEDRMNKLLQKEMQSVDLFMDIAEKEYFKRKISKQTFSDIERIAGKKRVKIKARQREIDDAHKSGKMLNLNTKPEKENDEEKTE